MRSISARFCAVVVAFALAFSGFVFWRTWSSTRNRMEELVARESELALEFDLAIRKYVAEKIRPEMAKRVKPDEFVIEAMSTSFVARSIFDLVREKLPDYVIKFSSSAPRNPDNMAGPEELRMIEYFKENPQITRWTGHLHLGAEDYWVDLSPMRVEPSCLQCHGRPEDAPASLVQRYGPHAGFNLRLGEIAGLDTVAVPLATVQSAMFSEAITQSVAAGVGLLALFGAIFGAFQWMIGRRLKSLAGHFRSVACQEGQAALAPLPVSGDDEISSLTASFNVLAQRLGEMHSSLEQQVAQRTAELEAEVIQRRKAEASLRSEQRVLRNALDIHEQHRKLLAYEIHDGVTQVLTGALMSVDASLGHLDGRQVDDARQNVGRARGLLVDTIAQSRRLMTVLRPSVLDDMGAIAAIDSLVTEAQVDGRTRVDYICDVQFERLIPALETALFRIVQESLANARRHSQSERVQIRIVQQSERLRIEIRDWGVGFDRDLVDTRHFGLDAIRERAELLGGRAVVTSAPGEGTSVIVDLPVIEADAEDSPEGL